MDRFDGYTIKIVILLAEMTSDCRKWVRRKMKGEGVFEEFIIILSMFEETFMDSTACLTYIMAIAITTDLIDTGSL